MSEILDLGPIRRRWADGTSTSGDVACLMAEVTRLRLANAGVPDLVRQREKPAAGGERR